LKVKKRSMEKGYSTLYREHKGTTFRGGRAAQLIPHWLVRDADHPLMGYFAALLLSNVTLSATILLVRFFPTFAYPAALNILGILIIALMWGAGPSLFATLLETLLLNLVLLPPEFAWSFHALAHWVDSGTFLLIGLAISLIASRIERAREQAVLAWQRLHDLFMQAPANIAVLRGPQHRFELANPTYLRTAGRANVLGKSVREVFAEAEQEPFMQMMDQVYTTGIPFVGNEVWAQMRTADGLKEGYFTFVCQPTHASNGEVDGLLFHGVEVTEQVKARQRIKASLDALLAMAEVLVQSPTQESPAQQVSLEQSQQAVSRLAALIRQVLACERVGILHIEPQTHTLQPIALVGSLTQEQQQWFTELAGRRLDDYLAPSLRERLLASEVVGNTLCEQTATLAMANEINPTLFAPLCVGSRLLGLLLLDWGDGKGTPSPEECILAGAVSKLAALMIERERLLRERTQAQANELAAQEATRRMDTFLGIASHELKTPLTVIKGNLQLILWQVQESVKRQDLCASAKGREDALLQMLVDIGQQVNRLSRLVNDLIEVSRAHTDSLEMRLEVCDLGAIVGKIVEEQRAVALKRTIHFERGASGPVLVYADADRLGQVVTNYLTNALKYSPAEQPVEVRVEQEAGSVRVLVRDRGPGLDPCQQKQVWERFHRVEGVKVQSGSSVGLGLGLYISRMIIEGHQGQVGVESLPGEGSTFWFALPTLQIEEEEDECEQERVLQEE
jgi:K+-sensing histidine kinase KdpD